MYRYFFDDHAVGITSKNYWNAFSRFQYGNGFDNGHKTKTGKCHTIGTPLTIGKRRKRKTFQRTCRL